MFPLHVFGSTESEGHGEGRGREKSKEGGKGHYLNAVDTPPQSISLLCAASTCSFGISRLLGTTLTWPSLYVPGRATRLTVSYSSIA